MTTICLPDAGARELLGELPDGIETVTWDGTGPAPPGITDASLLVAPFGPMALSAEALAQLPALEVIQLLSAGAEAWLGHVPDGVVLCNARGAHGGSTAELAVAGILSLLKDLAKFEQTKQTHEWARGETDGLVGKRVLILGAGDIGRRIAAVAQIFDAEVTFVGRRVRAGVHGVADLPHLLPQHEIVVIALPHTPQTVRLVDASFLAAMPDHAMLVNIARGPIVDTDALLAELGTRR
ncbi:MAG: NAD(P)-dependent oxidoreductase, partial [Pseudonocardiales bacterium]